MMKRIFERVFPKRPSISREEFRAQFKKYIFYNIAAFIIFFIVYYIGLQYRLVELQVMSLSLLLFLQIIAIFISCLKLNLEGRLMDIYPREKKISPLAPVQYFILPLTYIPLLVYLLFKNEKHVNRRAPLFLRNAWVSLPVIVIIFIVQLTAVGFRKAPRQTMALSFWINSPSINYILSVANNALLSFELKKRLELPAADVSKELEYIYKFHSINSTGYILNTAVLASYAFNKNNMLTKSEAAVSLVEYVLMNEKRRKKQNSVSRINPLIFISTANLVELAAVSLIELNIERKYEKLLYEKISKNLTEAEENNRKNENLALKSRIASFKREWLALNKINN